MMGERFLAQDAIVENLYRKYCVDAKKVAEEVGYSGVSWVAMFSGETWLESDIGFSSSRAMAETDNYVRRFGVTLPREKSFITINPRERYLKSYCHSLWGAAIVRRESDDPTALIALLNNYQTDPHTYGLLNRRIVGHVGRLLLPERTSVENDFGMAMVQYAPDYLKMFPKPVVLGGETRATCWYWTLMPYVYDKLTEFGLSPRRTTYLCIYWSSLSNRPSLNDCPMGVGNTYIFGGSVILEKNGNDKSHQFAELIADRLVGTGFFEEIQNGWKKPSVIGRTADEVVKRQEINDLVVKIAKVCRLREQMLS